MITSEQIRAARALLRIEQTDLAEKSGVSLATIKRIETTPGEVTANGPTIAAMRAALHEAGVIFVDENGDGPGVRLRKKPQPHPVDFGAPKPTPVSTKPTRPRSRRMGS